MYKSWQALKAIIGQTSRIMGYLSAIGIIISAVVLVYEVIIRYVFAWPTDWEVEFCVITLIICTFMSGAYTQLVRGHVTMEVLETILPSRINRMRMLLADILSLLFCAFVAWKAWQLFFEAWQDGRTSDSMWAPRLWIPYLSMAAGMALLSVQMLVQIIEDLLGWGKEAAPHEGPVAGEGA